LQDLGKHSYDVFISNISSLKDISIAAINDPSEEISRLSIEFWTTICESAVEK